MAADLTKIENELSNISGSLGGFVATDGTFENGIKKIESILSIGNKKTKVKNSTSTGSTTGGKTLGFTVGAILGTLEKSKKSIDEINGYTKNASDFLREIKNHITSNSAPNNSPSNTNSANNSNSSGNLPINSIDKNVEDILSELKKIRADVYSKFSKTGKDTLDSLILENLEKSEKLKSKRLDIEAAKEKVLRGEATEAEKNLIKEDADKRRKGKRELEKLEGGRGYVPAALATSALSMFTSFVKEKPDASKSIDKGIGIASGLLMKAGPLGAVIGGVMQAVKALFDLGAKQDKATTEFARTVGGFNRGKFLAGESARGLIATGSAKRGYTADAAYSAMTEIAEARGRTTERLSAKSLESAIDLKRFGIGAEAINNFDTFGKSIEETDRYFAKLYSEVSKKGLSFKNVSKAVNDNLKAAQSHTFANGIRGLERMAERSTQLKYNMQQVFQFADKVSEIEGAISTAANLSVLGGSFAQFSNPMQLLYEGLNDTEALQKRIENIFGDKVFWDQNKGQMDMSALDREMVKQAAKSMGLSSEEMLSLSFNQGRMKRVEQQLGKGLSKDTTEYIKNIAELDKNGNAFVNIDGKNINVKDLDESYKDKLEKESAEKNKADNAKLGDIYQNTRSVNEKLDNLLVYLQEKLGRWVFGMFQHFIGKNQREVAQGTGTEELKELRGQLFDTYSGTNPKKRAREIARMGKSELQYELEQSKTPKSPNGFNPMIPGNSGILRGSSHFNGGIKGLKNGIPWEAEGNEYLINKNSSIRYKYELAKIQNGTFNPYSYANDLIKNDMNKYFGSLKVAPIQKNTANTGNVPNYPNNVNGTIKIDIPQTITINLAGGEKIGDYDIRNIIMQYVDKIMKEATMRRDFSGFNKEEFYNKAGVI